jgi:hypothetical protein
LVVIRMLSSAFECIAVVVFLAGLAVLFYTQTDESRRPQEIAIRVRKQAQLGFALLASGILLQCLAAMTK